MPIFKFGIHFGLILNIQVFNIKLQFVGTVASHWTNLIDYKLRKFDIYFCYKADI